MPPGRSEENNLRVWIARFHRAIRNAQQLHVIVDRAVPGPPLPVPNIDLVPDDPGVDPTSIPLGQATHELAPVILGVVPAEIEVARHAVRRAVGARPAGSV